VLETARANWEILANPKRKSEWPLAETAYNDAIAILFDKLRCGPGDWTDRAGKLGTEISASSATNGDLSKLDALFPASAVKLPSEYRVQRDDGVGIPAVGWRTTSPVGVPRPAFYPPNGQPRNTTVALDFSTAVPQWKFFKRWVKNTYEIEGTPHHLAANWTAPINFFWYMCELDDLRIQNVLLPNRFTEETKLYFLEPYNPDKIPLVMVHGLVSSPDAYPPGSKATVEGDAAAQSSVRPPTSITSLSPKSRSFTGFNQLSLPKGITFHSIIGDKGHNDTPHSSDGVVPYWSSHIAPVESELIIDSNHSVPDKAETSDEIRRILLLHLRQEGATEISTAKKQ